MKSKIDGLLQGAIKWQEKRREKAMDSSDFSANSWHIKRGGVKHADRKMESDIGLDVLRPETACLSKTGLQSVCARVFCVAESTLVKFVRVHFKSSWELEREDALERETADPHSVSFDALTLNVSKPGHIKMVHRLHVDEHDEMMMRFMEEDALRAASLNDPADVGMEHEGDKSKLDMDEVAAALFRNERKV